MEVMPGYSKGTARVSRLTLAPGSPSELLLHLASSPYPLGGAKG